MSNGTHMNESWHTYEWVMAHIWIRHGTHMNQWVMAHIWMSHGTNVNESWHTYEWVVTQIPYLWGNSADLETQPANNHLCVRARMHACAYVCVCVCVRVCAYVCVRDCVCARTPTFGYVAGRHSPKMNRSTHEWVVSHISMIHVTHVNKSCPTHECVTSHTFPRCHKSCHTHQCVILCIIESCLTHKLVTPHTVPRPSAISHSRIQSVMYTFLLLSVMYAFMCVVCLINVCRLCRCRWLPLLWVMSHTLMRHATHTYGWVMAHILISHGTCMNESWRPNMNESWHTYEYVMTCRHKFRRQRN